MGELFFAFGFIGCTAVVVAIDGFGEIEISASSKFLTDIDVSEMLVLGWFVIACGFCGTGCFAFFCIGNTSSDVVIFSVEIESDRAFVTIAPFGFAIELLDGHRCIIAI